MDRRKNRGFGDSDQGRRRAGGPFPAGGRALFGLWGRDGVNEQVGFIRVCVCVCVVMSVEDRVHTQGREEA